MCLFNESPHSPFKHKTFTDSYGLCLKFPSPSWVGSILYASFLLQNFSTVLNLIWTHFAFRFIDGFTGRAKTWDANFISSFTQQLLTSFYFISVAQYFELINVPQIWSNVACFEELAEDVLQWLQVYLVEALKCFFLW